MPVPLLQRGRHGGGKKTQARPPNPLQSRRRNRQDRTMDFSLSPEQEQIRDEVRKLCAQFDDAYWLEKDRTGDFPHELHAALAAAGWLGIAMPEEHGGAGLGITEAVLMMQAVAESGAAMS